MRPFPSIPLAWIAIAMASALLLPGCASRGAAGAAPSAFDAARAHSARSVVLVTSKPQGGRRETRVWVVAHDGLPVVRSSAGRWFSDVVRDRRLAVRVDGVEHPVRAELVGNDEEIERIDTSFRAKYGWKDRLLNDFLVHDIPLLERRDLVVRLHPR